MKYLFGPVNSRRLGISLGIDLVPYKTCTLSCVYCECGRTTILTSQVDEYVPTGEVIAEIDEYLSSGPGLDVLTFSGSGEPTLHRDIGKVIDHIKKNFPDYKIAVLTNGTLFWNADIRKAIIRADYVIPSLDAVSRSIFKKILKPSKGITARKHIKGLVNFRKEFKGKYILEIFIVPGVNDKKSELKKIKDVCKKILPDKIELNRLDRPGSEDWVKQARWQSLVEIKEFFKPLDVELIGEPENTDKSTGKIFQEDQEIVDSILSTLKRRPSTIEDLLHSAGISKIELLKHLDGMLEKGIIEKDHLDRGLFYKMR